jgi:halocyanin-like protein
MRLETDTNGTATRRSFLRGAAAAVGTTAAASAGVGTTTAQSGPDYGDWFSNTGNFDGTYDYTGKKEVTVYVGTEGNGTAYGFGPAAAIRVDPGTKVTWKWTGKGGSHNVEASDGSFKSDMLSEAGATFSHTFEKEGTFEYFCRPHKMMGMKGAVVVGGSGGKDPSGLSAPKIGSSGGSGEGGGSGDGDGSGSNNSTLVSASVLTGGVMAFISPIVFGIFLLLQGSDDGAE